MKFQGQGHSWKKRKNSIDRKLTQGNSTEAKKIEICLKIVQNTIKMNV